MLLQGVEDLLVGDLGDHGLELVLLNEFGGEFGRLGLLEVGRQVFVGDLDQHPVVYGLYCH